MLRRIKTSFKEQHYDPSVLRKMFCICRTLKRSRVLRLIVVYSCTKCIFFQFPEVVFHLLPTTLFFFSFEAFKLIQFSYARKCYHILTCDRARWSLLEKFDCSASKLHLKPRRYKTFVQALVCYFCFASQYCFSIIVFFLLLFLLYSLSFFVGKGAVKGQKQN